MIPIVFVGTNMDPFRAMHIKTTSLVMDAFVRVSDEAGCRMNELQLCQ